MEFGILDGVLLILAITVAVTGLLRLLEIPAIVGYILVGIIVGPHVFGVVNETEVTKELAELGIVFLLFTIGLEFSLTKLNQLKRIVFLFGGLQVLLTIVITTVIGIYLSLTVIEAIIVGAVVSMSSTAIVTKQLAEQQEISSEYGMNSFAVLLFQDLAVIPLLILVPSLAGEVTDIGITLGFASLKGIVAIVVILVSGYFLLRPIFSAIYKTGSSELFTLSVLLVTIGAAWFTYQLGLSLALGAFLAGMMLAETEFRHQIAADIRPFRDVLLGFFFVSVGTQVDLGVIGYAWPWMLLLFAALVVFKFLLIAMLGMFFTNKINAVRSGMVLAQGGEFGFAILTLALGYRILPLDYGQVVLAALLMSMIVAPIIIRHNGKLTAMVFRRAVV